MSGGFVATPEQIEAVRARFRSEGTCAELLPNGNICIQPAGHDPAHGAMSPDPITTLADALTFAADYVWEAGPVYRWTDADAALEQVRTLVEAARESVDHRSATLYPGGIDAQLHDALQPFISGDTESG